MPPIAPLPEAHAGDTLVVSISGGKDSTAAALALREAGYQFRCVFADTGWEAPQTYAQIDLLEKILDRIDRVGHPGGMAARIRERNYFPTRVIRWCTGDLKLDVLAEYLERVREETDGEVVSVVGVRREESTARATASEFEYQSAIGWNWRPIVHWTVQDVLAIHHRHGVPVNPLYTLGFDRVGCMPCVFANKNDLRLLSRHFPERVQLLRELEQEVTSMRGKPSTFIRDSAGRPLPIDEAIAWSRTSHGGKQLPLIQDAPDSGCFRWGLCDPPAIQPTRPDGTSGS